MSSSTRGTWIEIVAVGILYRRQPGRPPHGGRGLKSSNRLAIVAPRSSSSTRGTWIEIEEESRKDFALSGRPPHGGRGLKSAAATIDSQLRLVVLHTGDVD